MTDLQVGNSSDRRHSMAACEGLLGINSDVTMHIISSLSSMDETSMLLL